MTETAQARATWRPLPRPEWVSDLNGLGSCAGSAAALVSLDAGSMLDAAVAATGLDDFGGDAWREPFRIMVDDLNNTAQLNVVGRLLARTEVVRALTARLRIAQAYKDNPEIEQEEIREPVFITGMGRSGTSILLEVMAQDPAFRSALSWELLHPAPPPEPALRLTDPRIALTDAEYDLWNQVTPELATMHELGAGLPNECHTGTMIEFCSPIWGGEHCAPNHDMWWALNGAAQTYRFHRRMLKLLQFRTPGRWLLKGPGHFGTLPALFEEYPDARLVVTHRDPVKVLTSMFSLMSTLRWQRSDHLDVDAMVAMVSFGYEYLLSQLLEQRASGAIPAGRIVDVHYQDLISDPLGTIGTAYERLGTELTRGAADRMSGYLAGKPQGKHGVHSYSFDELGLDLTETRARFAAYVEHYGVAEET